VRGVQDVIPGGDDEAEPVPPETAESHALPSVVEPGLPPQVSFRCFRTSLRDCISQSRQVMLATSFCFVSGHDFSRAVKERKKDGAFRVCVRTLHLVP
jgi:hypothetical protein